MDTSRFSFMGANTAQKAILTVDEGTAGQKQADKALTSSDSCWQGVVENSAMGIAVTDLKGRFVAANVAYRQMLGSTEEELRGLSFLGFAQETDPEGNGTVIQQLLDGQREQFETEKCYQ